MEPFWQKACAKVAEQTGESEEHVQQLCELYFQLVRERMIVGSDNIRLPGVGEWRPTACPYKTYRPFPIIRPNSKQ